METLFREHKDIIIIVRNSGATSGVVGVVLTPGRQRGTYMDILVARFRIKYIIVISVVT